MKANEAMVGFPAEIMAGDLIPTYTDVDGEIQAWKVVHDVPPRGASEHPGNFRYVPVTRDSDEVILGDELRRRAEQFRGNRGLADAKQFLLKQERIPRQLLMKDIAFPGTVLKDQRDGKWIPVLRFSLEDRRRRVVYVPYNNKWTIDTIIPCLLGGPN